MGVLYKKTKEAEMVCQVRTEDTIFSCFELKVDKKKPIYDFDEFMKASGRPKLENPLPCAFWNITCNITHLLEFIDELTELDYSYKRLKPPLKDIYYKNPKQRMICIVLSTRDGWVIKKINEFF